MDSVCYQRLALSLGFDSVSKTCSRLNASYESFSSPAECHINHSEMELELEHYRRTGRNRVVTIIVEILFTVHTVNIKPYNICPYTQFVR